MYVNLNVCKRSHDLGIISSVGAKFFKEKCKDTDVFHVVIILFLSVTE